MCEGWTTGRRCTLLTLVSRTTLASVALLPATMQSQISVAVSETLVPVALSAVSAEASPFSSAFCVGQTILHSTLLLCVNIRLSHIVF